MPSVCLYFKAHQPFLLKPFSSMDIDVSHTYFDTEASKAAIHESADNYYLPCHNMLLALIDKYKDRFKINVSISGVTIELLQLHRPDVIDCFRNLVNTGCANILAQTYYHSLSYLHSRKEFQRQLFKHQTLVKKIFGVQTTDIRNTAIIRNNELARHIASAGLKGILYEGNEGDEFGNASRMTVPQQNLLKKIYALENLVLNSGCEKTIDTWGRLQTQDYFTTPGSFQSFSNIVTDFEITLIRQTIETHKKRSALPIVRATLL